MDLEKLFTVADIVAAQRTFSKGKDILDFLYRLRCSSGHRLELEDMKTALLQNQTMASDPLLEDIKNYFTLLEENAEKIVMVVDNSAISENLDGKIQIASVPLKARAVSYNYPFCQEMAFGDQQSAKAKGTGFFIGDNIIATAAHVVMTDNANITDVSNIRFVQGVRINQHNTFANGIVVEKSQVYKPVTNSLEPNSYYWSDFGSDYAVMHVEGAYANTSYPTVKGVRCPNIQTYNQLFTSGHAVNTRLYAMGHGLALPLKVSYYGEIIKANKTFPYFEASLSLLGGNSGSPVFDANTHELVGIYIRGIKKLEKKDGKNCLDVKEEDHHSSKEGQECQRLELVLKSLEAIQQIHS